MRLHFGLTDFIISFLYMHLFSGLYACTCNKLWHFT